MSSRFIYIVLFAATLAATVMAAVWLPADFHPAVIVAGLVLLALEVWLYVALVRPVRTLANGIGLIRAQDFSSRLARVGQIDADRLVETFNRMMDVLKSERLRLNERNNFLQLLIDASPAAIVVGDFDGRVTDCNPAAVALFGALPPGATLASLPGDLGAACASLPRGASAMVRLSNTEIYRCSSLSFMESGFSRPFLLVESVTEEVRRAERQAGHRIVRAMAHEVNNTIGGVGTILEILADTPLDAPMHDAVAACLERCRALSGFVTDYASVVKVPAPECMPENLSEMMAGMLPFFSGLLPRDGAISISLHTDGDNVVVDADKALFQQAMVNIVKNAAESILSTGGSGEIRIEVGAAPARVVVADNGPGLSPEVVGRLFAPFFTTKPTGQGLGLMLVGEILDGHRCRYSLRTDPTDGLTRFTVIFPSSRKQ